MAGGAHGDGDGAAADADLERLFGGEGVAFFNRVAVLTTKHFLAHVQIIVGGDHGCGAPGRFNLRHKVEWRKF